MMGTGTTPHSTFIAAASSARSTPASRRRDEGFTLVEVSTSVAMLLVVLTAAWMLLTVSNANLTRIDSGGQASELNRAALASFERDLGHSVLPRDDQSSVIGAASRRCALLVDEDDDEVPELVVWSADDANGTLVRTVTRATETTQAPQEESDFAGGETQSAVVLEGLASEADTPGAPLFTYATDATTGFTSRERIGLITIHLRNGLPVSEQNTIDRTASFRVLALVINGY